jgi:DNA-directed RNA polymerase subunit M/transcription elongation factor TFIIS
MKVQCPRCSKLLVVPDKSAGTRMKCAGCGQIIQVPLLEEPSTYEQRKFFAEVVGPDGARAKPPSRNESRIEVAQDERAKQAGVLAKKRGTTARNSDFICPNCGSTSRPRLHHKASTATEVLLWLIFTLPGMGVAVFTVFRYLSSSTREIADPLKGGPTVFQEHSILLLIIASLLYAFPGILYSIAKMTTSYKGCSACGAPYMIPTDSPRGRKLPEEDWSAQSTGRS